jgi:hypothetical protein
MRSPADARFISPSGFENGQAARNVDEFAGLKVLRHR